MQNIVYTFYRYVLYWHLKILVYAGKTNGAIILAKKGIINGYKWTITHKRKSLTQF